MSVKFFSKNSVRNVKGIAPLTVSVQYICVAGGGGGTDAVVTVYDGLGGGAGGMLDGTIELNMGTDYTVTIGAGGATSGDSPFAGNPSIFGSIFTIFGGAGCRSGRGSGGSGGGFSGSGYSGQGFGGGLYAGGGAGEAGGTDGNGAGGDGKTVSWFTTTLRTALGNVGGQVVSSSVFFAGGGGALTSAGGDGGGGNGGGFTPATGATAGLANSGGGGGGGQAVSGRTSPGAGGSGVVVIRYPNAFKITQTGLTATTANDGDFKVTIFTAGTGTVTFS